MEVAYDQWIDAGINALGYLVASGLAVLVYSVFQRKRAPQEQAAPVTAHKTAEPAPTATVSDSPKARFVDFRRSDSTAANGDLAGAVSRVSSAPTGRRDRAEIIRLAREMIKAKTPQETIKRTLPISDGELALLQSNNN